MYMHFVYNVSFLSSGFQRISPRKPVQCVCETQPWNLQWYTRSAAQMENCDTIKIKTKYGKCCRKSRFLHKAFDDHLNPPRLEGLHQKFKPYSTSSAFGHGPSPSTHWEGHVRRRPYWRRGDRFLVQMPNGLDRVVLSM